MARNVFQRIDGAVRVASIGAVAQLPIAFLVLISPGVFAYFLENPNAVERHFLHNRLVPDERHILLARIAGSALLMASALTLSIARERWIAGRFSSKVFWRAIAPWVWVIGLPAWMVLFVDSFEVEHPFQLIMFACFAATSAGVSAAAVADRIGTLRPAFSERARGSAAVFVVLFVAAVYAVKMTEIHLQQHYAFLTTSYDLGIYTNTVWHTWNGDFLGCAFLIGGTHTSAHYDPILALFGPLMMIHRGAETLLWTQSVWLASATIPVYLIGARHAGRVFGVVAAIVYLAHPALHGANLFDFHSLTLMVPCVLWAAYFIETGARWRLALSLAFLLACREDMALVGGLLGLYAITVHRRTRAGILIIATSCVYLALVKLYGMPDPSLLMTDSTRAAQYGSYFAQLNPGGDGATGIIATLVGNPFYLVRLLLREERLLYAVQLLAPVAFLPLIARRRWILFGYAILFLGLSSRDAAGKIGFHYAAIALPCLFIVAPPLVRGVADRMFRGRGIPVRSTIAFFGAFMLVATAITSAAFGAFIPNDRFRAGWLALNGELTFEDRDRYATFLELTRDIPPDAAVSASNSAMPHVAARMRLEHMPHLDQSEWVVIRQSRMLPHELEGLRELRRDTATWVLVAEEDGVIIFRRRQDSDGPAPVPVPRPTPPAPRPSLRPALPTDGGVVPNLRLRLPSHTETTER